MKLAFIIDPIAKLDPTHDSSVAMMEAAGILGHQVYITTAEKLAVINGRAAAYLQSKSHQSNWSNSVGSPSSNGIKSVHRS
jgi:glutathione synthase/RimK-type ligase-like ATP-grasp enzyme